MSDDLLRGLVDRARHVATSFGPLHGLWDLISDAEENLAGRVSVFSRVALESALTKELARQDALRDFQSSQNADALISLIKAELTRQYQDADRESRGPFTFNEEDDEIGVDGFLNLRQLAEAILKATK